MSRGDDHDQLVVNVGLRHQRRIVDRTGHEPEVELVPRQPLDRVPLVTDAQAYSDSGMALTELPQNLGEEVDADGSAGTDDQKTAGRQVRASKDEPQYRVTSDKTGADAVHKPDALRRDK